MASDQLNPSDSPPLSSSSGPPASDGRLLHAPTASTLLRLTGPMVVGIAAIVFFNLVDTFWVGQLGPLPLAAMGFTFPVTMVVSNLCIGLSIGASTVIAQAIGAAEAREVRRLTTDALLLALVTVLCVAATGLIAMHPIFVALGASSETLPLIDSYMRPWFWGIGWIVVPMIGNGAIRATGDTRGPAVIMMVAGLINAGLDPVLIFGFGPVPAMGLRGAALATITSFVFATVVACWILFKRERMVVWRWVPLSRVLTSFRKILAIGLPAVATNLLTPLSSAVVVRLVAGHGPAAVAAFGVGVRIESLSMVGIFALTAAITPFVGQNLGAGKTQRIEEARRFTVSAAWAWCVPVAIILALMAPLLAAVFNDQPEVVRLTTLYLRLVPGSYVGFAMALLTASMFNALNVPLRATGVAFLRLVVLAVPLAYLGSAVAGLEGLFVGIAVANLAVGIVAYGMGRQRVAALSSRVKHGSI